MDILAAVILSIFVAFSVSYCTDQSTVNDCATKGQARLASRVTINCSIVQEAPTKK